MKKIFSLLLIVVMYIIDGGLCAQNSLIQGQCGTDQHHQYKMQSDPQYRKDYEETEQKIQEILKNKALYQKNKTNPTLQSGPPYTIPVVFHVITTSGFSGPSDGSLISDLADVNTEFNRTVRFSNPAGMNTEIQFCLAQRDPNGCITTGII